MATAINLGRQRLRQEHGIGGTLNYENMARQAGVMALRAPQIPHQEKTAPEEAAIAFTDEQLRALAGPAIEKTAELVDA
ncbi:MAG: hypothetical protein JWO41_317 [Candidatus Saccharibacteria bacterium]|nr:hypothetical protein [Candidatus Saccharibacteria bacterium]